MFVFSIYIYYIYYIIISLFTCSYVFERGYAVWKMMFLCKVVDFAFAELSRTDKIIAKSPTLCQKRMNNMNNEYNQALASEQNNFTKRTSLESSTYK